MSEKGDADEVKSEPETQQETQKEEPKPEPVKQEKKKQEPPKQETKEERKQEEPERSEDKEENKDDEDTALRKETTPEKEEVVSVSSANDREDDSQDDNADDKREASGKPVIVDDNDHTKSPSGDKDLINQGNVSSENAEQKVSDDSDRKITESTEQNKSETVEQKVSNDSKQSEVTEEKSKVSFLDENEKDKTVSSNEKEIEVETKEKREENGNQEKQKEEEKAKDEYVPLDKLWSSPKREFKGVQGDYSFRSRRSDLSSSSYKEQTSDKPKETSVSETKTEVESDTTKDKVVSSDQKPQETVEPVSVKDKDDENDKRPSDEGQKENIVQISKSDDSKASEEAEKHDENERVMQHDKVDSDQETDAKPVMATQSSTLKSDNLVDEQIKEKKDDEVEEQITRKDDSTSETRQSRGESPSSPRRSRDRYDSDSSRSLSGSPRRTPPPTEMKWEKDDDDVNENSVYDDDKFESEDSEKELAFTQKEEEAKGDKAGKDKGEQKGSSEKTAVDGAKSNKAKKEEGSPRSNQQRAISSPRQIISEERRTQRQGAKSAVTHKNEESPRALSPAQARSPRSSYIRYTPKEKPKAKPRPKTTSGGRSIASEEGRRKQKEFFKAELQRLERSLGKESEKISRPKQRAYYPFVWTSLEPYYNTYVARYLIDVAEDPRPGFVSRNTAIGLCDPWTDLKMDRDLLPRLETPARTKRAQKQEMKEGGRKDKKGKKPPKEGSTRLPKFPIVDFNTQRENATKQFPYYEVPKFREGMKGRYGQKAPKKVESDYIRTRQDFYRMDLDRLDEIHPINRPHMRKAYFAYLQNTPGSRKAIKECVKNLSEQEKAEQEMPPQQAQQAN